MSESSILTSGWLWGREIPSYLGREEPKELKQTSQTQVQCQASWQCPGDLEIGRTLIGKAYLSCGVMVAISCLQPERMNNNAPYKIKNLM